MSLTLAQTCVSENQLLVLQGEQLPALSGVPVNHLSVKRWNGKRFQTMIFQIDRRDKQGSFDFSEDKNALFDNNDELVILNQLAGDRYEKYRDNAHILAEVSVSAEKQGRDQWIYVFNGRSEHLPVYEPRVKYDAIEDTVQTNTYHAGFSTTHPFLMTDFRWRDPETTNYSKDLVDTMKIRHHGRLFGFLKFHRSQLDYTSRLIAVKQGPLRVIRRTENRVRVFWKLKSPSVLIDYVMMPDSFVMDTLIDLPFRIGAFFKDLETVTTVDWNQQVLDLQFSGVDESGDELFRIDGSMSETERQLNVQQENMFQLVSEYGKMLIALELPQDLPIQSWKYYVDDSAAIDPPEFTPGQYGNLGFRTIGWENVMPGLRHVDFTVCLTSR
ncbi:MAG: hypothetical protein V3W04_01170 [Gammaproteobacteria bacterium]